MTITEPRTPTAEPQWPSVAGELDGPWYPAVFNSRVHLDDENTERVFAFRGVRYRFSRCCTMIIPRELAPNSFREEEKCNACRRA